MATVVERQLLARWGRMVTALAFLPPIFLLLTSVDAMIVAAAARQVTPEVFAGIAALVVLVVVARRVLITWFNGVLAVGGRAPGRLRRLGAGAAMGGPLLLIVAGSLDFAAILAIIAAGLPELIAIAAAAAIVSLIGRTAYRASARVVRILRGDGDR